jgi:hypothetical protein
MALSPEQHLRIADTYAKAAADYRVPPDHKRDFARKAEFYRIAARIGSKTVTTAQSSHPIAAIKSLATPMLSLARHLFAWQQRRAG